jgi:hypothetical protein
MICIRRALLNLLFVLVLQSTCAASSLVVAPSSAQVKPGAQVQFTTTGLIGGGVVVWSLSGNGCVGTACGEIDYTGNYTAPAVAPNPPQVTVTATSLSDVTQSSSATVTIGTSISVSVAIAPTSVSLAPGGQQQFSATVSGSSNKAVTWTIGGTGCTTGLCGKVTSAGLYTAPSALPVATSATVTATSQADSTKSVSAKIIFISAASVSVQVSPTSAQVNVGGQQQFSATVSGSTNSAVTWSVAGTGCSGTACGTISTSGLYTAPSSVPSNPAVFVTANSVAAPGRTSSAQVTILAAASGMVISPSSPLIKAGGQVQFLASGPGSEIVIWSLSGSGCTGLSCGSISSSGLYQAPATAPASGTVTVTATSILNPAATGSTNISFGTAAQVAIVLSPISESIDVGQKLQFTAKVSGTTNTAVNWSVTGYGCAGSACGTITTGGLYMAPAVQPNPAIVFVTATSVADPTKSDTATLTINTALAISLTPASATVDVNTTKQFTAKVTGTSNTTVDWSVSGVGCSGAACGTISSAGLYTAPATIPTPATVTIKATSAANSSVSSSATVTVVSPISVSVTPASAQISISDQLQFQAVVTGTSNLATVWSVSGAGCTGSKCGTISSTGFYTAPATVPSPAVVKVTATSQALSSVSASSAITIVPLNNAKFVGQYAFQLSGFDTNGAYEAVGYIKADGKGNILSGSEDVNDTVGPSLGLSISGTYQVAADNRGVMTITSSSGTHTLRFALNQSGSSGRLISSDLSGVRVSGVIKRQDPTALNASALTGGYVLKLTGMNVFAQRFGALGLIFPDGTSFIAGSSMDVNEGGVVQPTFAAFSGTYTVDDTGHGTTTLSIPGFDGGIFDLSFYVVSSNEFLVISVDTLSYGNPLFGGVAEAQTGAPFTTAAFQGGSVFELSGNNGTAPDDTVGLLDFGQQEAATVIYDENNGGQITITGGMTGAYDIELNGRGTLNLVNDQDGSQLIWYVYATSPNSGFIMDASTSEVSVGELAAQAAISEFSNSSLLGTFYFGSDENIFAQTPLDTGSISFDGGSNESGLGSLTGVEDISQVSGTLVGQSLGGNYTVSPVSNNGRGTLLLSSPSGSTIAVWIASSSKVFGLDVDPTSVLPAILYFEQ